MTPATTQAVLPLGPRTRSARSASGARDLREPPRGLPRREVAAGEPPHRAVGRARREGLPRRQPARGVRRRRARACAGSRPWARRSPAAGCSLLLIVVSPAIVGAILARHGTEEQKERWLPRHRRRAPRKVAFAITEPDAGTNSHNLSTTATRDGDGYLLRGQKTYISGVEDARRACWWSRATAMRRRRARPARRWCSSTSTRPASRRDEIPMRRHRPGQAVDALLRRRRGAPPTAWSASEGGGPRRRCSTGSTRSGSWAASVAMRRRRAARSSRRRAYANERKVWERADRRPPGHRAPAGRGQDRARAGRA